VSSARTIYEEKRGQVSSARTIYEEKRQLKSEEKALKRRIRRARSLLAKRQQVERLREAAGLLESEVDRLSR